jgi:hypothetical protein
MGVPAIMQLVTPTALSATLTTNILNPSANTYAIIRQIHVVNKTGGAVTFSLWVGGSGGNVAGTEFFNGQSVGANQVYDWYGAMKLTASQYLVGGASAGTSLTITVMGELYAVLS